MTDICGPYKLSLKDSSGKTGISTSNVDEDLKEMRACVELTGDTNQTKSKGLEEKDQDSQNTTTSTRFESFEEKDDEDVEFEDKRKDFEEEDKESQNTTMSTRFESSEEKEDVECESDDHQSVENEKSSVVVAEQTQSSNVQTIEITKVFVEEELTTESVEMMVDAYDEGQNDEIWLNALERKVRETLGRFL